jgi:hypothetical protein
MTDPEQPTAIEKPSTSLRAGISDVCDPSICGFSPAASSTGLEEDPAPKNPLPSTPPSASTASKGSSDAAATRKKTAASTESCLPSKTACAPEPQPPPPSALEGKPSEDFPALQAPSGPMSWAAAAARGAAQPAPAISAASTAAIPKQNQQALREKAVEVRTPVYTVNASFSKHSQQGSSVERPVYYTDSEGRRCAHTVYSGHTWHVFATTPLLGVHIPREWELAQFDVGWPSQPHGLSTSIAIYDSSRRRVNNGFITGACGVVAPWSTPLLCRLFEPGMMVTARECEREVIRYSMTNGIMLNPLDLLWEAEVEDVHGRRSGIDEAIAFPHFVNMGNGPYYKLSVILHVYIQPWNEDNPQPKTMAEYNDRFFLNITRLALSHLVQGSAISLVRETGGHPYAWKKTPTARSPFTLEQMGFLATSINAAERVPESELATANKGRAKVGRLKVIPASASDPALPQRAASAPPEANMSALPDAAPALLAALTAPAVGTEGASARANEANDAEPPAASASSAQDKCTAVSASAEGVEAPAGAAPAKDVNDAKDTCVAKT